MIFNTGLINNFKNIHEQILLERPEIIQLQELSPKVQSELKSLKSLITNKTKLVSVVHQSNVLGTINPIKRIIDNVRKKYT